MPKNLIHNFLKAWHPLRPLARGPVDCGAVGLPWVLGWRRYPPAQWVLDAGSTAVVLVSRC